MSTPQTVRINTSAYIGLCVTSGAKGELRTFQFDGISTAGGVRGGWQQVQISGAQ